MQKNAPFCDVFEVLLDITVDHMRQDHEVEMGKPRLAGVETEGNSLDCS